MRKRAGRRALSVRLRIGPVQVPVPLVAAGASVSVHAALMAAAYVVAWSPGGDTPPRIQLSRGERAVQVTILAEPWPEPEEPEEKHSAPPPRPRPPRDVRSAEQPEVEPVEPSREGRTALTEHVAKPLASQETGELAPAGAPVTAGPLKLHPVNARTAILQPAKPSEDEPAALKPESPQTASPGTKLAGSAPAPSSESASQLATEPTREAPAAQSATDAEQAEGVRTGVKAVDVPTPYYPRASRRRGEEGLVIVEIEVLADGKVGALEVVQGPGYPLLTEAALDAARKARFRPATRDGQPVRETVRIPFRFVLE